LRLAIPAATRAATSVEPGKHRGQLRHPISLGDLDRDQLEAILACARTCLTPIGQAVRSERSGAGGK